MKKQFFLGTSYIFLFLFFCNTLVFSQINDYIKSGTMQLEARRYHEAIQDFNEAIRLGAATENVYFWRGNAYFHLKNYSKAYQDFAEVVRLNPKNHQGLFQKAEASFQLKNFEIAQTDYQSAILLSDNNMLYEFCMMKALLALKKYSDVADIAIRMPKNDTLFSKMSLLKAIAYTHTQQVNLANELLDEYIQNYTKAKDFYELSKYIYEFSDDKALLSKSQNWILNAVQLQDSYQNNELYAKILYKLDKKLTCLEVSQKAISLAKKEGTDFLEVEQLINLINATNTDDIPPVITLVSPPVMRGGIFWNAKNELTIIGNATDDSGIKEVFVNGNPAKLFPNGDFESILLLKNDFKELTIEATDTKGNAEKVSFQLLQEAQNLDKSTTKRPKSLGNCYALVFATNQYEYWNDLQNPVTDAQMLAKDLKEQYDFDIDLVVNATQNQIILKLREYLKKKYQPNDQLFIFFAGHGQFDETFKEGYVVAKDSKLDDESKQTYLAHSTLRTYINNIDCKHILLMMDVCFGGTFDPQIASKGGIRGKNSENDTETEEFIRKKLTPHTRKYITSGGKEYVPDGTPGYHSPFVRQFLEALRNNGGKDKIITLAELMSFLETAKPTPHLGEFGNNEPGSDFLFVGK